MITCRAGRQAPELGGADAFLSESNEEELTMKDTRSDVALQSVASRSPGHLRARLLFGAGGLTALIVLILLPLISASAAGTKLPEAAVLPVVSPTTPLEDVPASGTTGSWTNGPTSLGYQWQRCNAGGAECANISGATSATYTPGEADAEHTLKLKVTATNSEGSTSASSAVTGAVPPAGQVTEYKLKGSFAFAGITAGPDGNAWFTADSPDKIDKITTSGTPTEYALPSESEPAGIAAGPDGNLWFADFRSGKIGKITTSGTITEYALPAGSQPFGIAEGPDKNLWFAEFGTSKIGKITTSGAITEYALPAGSTPRGIAQGPDKNLWFADGGTSKIGKITTSGTITEYAVPAGSGPFGIVAGPEKEDVWFTLPSSSKVGKITTSGTVTEYALPEKSGLQGIAAGPDGRLWVAGTKKIARITTSGAITEYAANTSPIISAIASGPDGYMWFGAATSHIGKIAP